MTSTHQNPHGGAYAETLGRAMQRHGVHLTQEGLEDLARMTLDRLEQHVGTILSERFTREQMMQFDTATDEEQTALLHEVWPNFRLVVRAEMEAFARGVADEFVASVVERR